jgi:hypothetical protein
MSDEEELAEMGLWRTYFETRVDVAPGTPIPGGALSVRIPGDGHPKFALVTLERGDEVYVHVPPNGRRYEAPPNNRIAVVDHGITATVRRT